MEISRLADNIFTLSVRVQGQEIEMDATRAPSVAELWIDDVNWGSS